MKLTLITTLLFAQFGLITISSISANMTDAIIGGANCPMTKPLTKITSDKIEYNFTILKVKNNAINLSCNYRVPISSNKNFKITNAKFIPKGGKLDKTSQLSITVSSGTDKKQTQLTSIKETDLDFPTVCTNSAILGTSINLVDKTQKTKLEKSKIELTLAPC
jgi:hypothetical protein